MTPPSAVPRPAKAGAAGRGAPGEPGGPPLYLVDGSGYVYRAFHAVPALTTARGLPTNATFGFTTMLLRLLREEQPRRVAVVFDAPGVTFRDRMYEEYKSNRPPVPDELRAQLPWIRRVVEAMRLPVVEEPGVEADDVIGTLAHRATAAGITTVIVTGDKDMMQLVGERTTLLDTMRGRRIGIAEVRERFGVEPARVPDVLGLMGDPTDNIPGVRGIGEKTAIALVAGIGSVEEILERPDAVEGLGVRGANRIREALERDVDAARLSTRLATIRRDLPLRIEPSTLRFDGPDLERLRPLFGELEFTSLLRELAPVSDAPEVPRVAARTAEDLGSALAALPSGDAVALAATLDSTSSTRASLQALAIAAADGPVVTLETPEEPGCLAQLAGLLSDPALTKIAGDVKALRVALGRRGLEIAGPTFDVGLASYCLDPSRADHRPAALAEALLGTRCAPDDPAAIARAAHALRPVLEEQLRAQDATGLFHDLETPLGQVLAAMELAGIGLDVATLRRLSEEFRASLDGLLEEIHGLAGGPFNVNSPPQLRTVLFERLGISTKGVRRGKTGLSTDVDVLTRLAAEHPLPAKILEYRGLAKLLSTYVDALPSLVDPETGRLHTSFNQTVAATGRLSSSDPNLQNIPIRTEEGRRIRAAFVAAPGHRLISADYSQIELRVLAHLANDPVLIEAFGNDEDIHARTATEVFGDRTDAEGRRLAKVINYGILYGMGPARAARELGVPQATAAAYIQRYFARYAGVRTFLDATVREGRERGWVSTLLGRRRYLPELTAREGAQRQFAERAATNTPIQGSAADLIKLAMLEVHRRLAGGRARLLLQVHDELVLEVPVEDVPSIRALVREVMEGVWSLRVPLRVDVHDGRDWAEAH